MDWTHGTSVWSYYCYFRSTFPPGGIIEDDRSEWDRVQNVLVGTNAIACQAAAQRAQELGFVPCILSTELSGEAKEVIYLFLGFTVNLSQRAYNFDCERELWDLLCVQQERRKNYEHGYDFAIH